MGRSEKDVKISFIYNQVIPEKKKLLMGNSKNPGFKVHFFMLNLYQSKFCQSFQI